SSISLLVSGKPNASSIGPIRWLTRAEGTAPATRKRSVASSSMTSSRRWFNRAVGRSVSHRRARVVGPAFSAETIASKSSGSNTSFLFLFLGEPSERLVQKSNQWNDDFERLEDGRVEPRRGRHCRRELAAGKELTIAQEIGGDVILRESARGALPLLTFRRAHASL